MSDLFYSMLAPHENFLDITNPKTFTPVPADWCIAITDIQGSTQAIQAGRYKEVNLLGAASIVALLNLAREIDLPFLFGGDGATVLLPPSLVERARPALLGTQRMAEREFGLLLRVGLVPVATVLEAKQSLGIAKFRISVNYEQAMFTGSGLLYAEHLLKNPTTSAQHALRSEGITPEADYTGLECRWQDVPSRFGETVALLVLATGEHPRENGAIYREVIAQIEAIYGDEEQYRPISPDTLRPAFDPRRLMLETKLRAKEGLLETQKYLADILARNVLLKYFIKRRVQTGEVRWDRYLEELVATSDYKKYDDTLRMIIAGTESQRERLTAYLEAEYRAGRLAYGLHCSDRALVTCVVFERMGRQVHFVDGADGGYALAALDLKERLRAMEKEEIWA